VDADSIRAQIWTNSWRISDCQADINNKSREIEALRSELRALDKDLESFTSAIQTQRRVYAGIAGRKNKQKLHNKLDPAMHDLLEGEAFGRATSRFHAARDEIQQEIRTKSMQLEEVQYNLRALNNSQYNLQIQLSQASS
jgi:chromosome segregation ATPase